MSKERIIYGNSVGPALPKSDLRETNPKKGSYVLGREMIGDLRWLGTEKKGSVVEAINEVAEKSITVSGAKVGQLLEVAAVDEKGVPTAWKAADGTRGLKHLRTVTIPEDISTDMSGVRFVTAPGGGVWFSFDTDKDGNQIDITELYCTYNATVQSDTSQHLCLTNLKVPSRTIYGIRTGSVINKSGTTAQYSFGWFYYKKDGDAVFCVALNNDAAPFPSLKSDGMDIATCVDADIRNTVCLVSRNSNVGFVPGSTFKFYGR